MTKDVILGRINESTELLLIYPVVICYDIDFFEIAASLFLNNTLGANKLFPQEGLALGYQVDQDDAMASSREGAVRVCATCWTLIFVIRHML